MKVKIRNVDLTFFKKVAIDIQLFKRKFFFPVFCRLLQDIVAMQLPISQSSVLGIKPHVRNEVIFILIIWKFLKIYQIKPLSHNIKLMNGHAN